MGLPVAPLPPPPRTSCPTQAWETPSLCFLRSAILLAVAAAAAAFLLYCCCCAAVTGLLGIEAGEIKLADAVVESLPSSKGLEFVFKVAHPERETLFSVKYVLQRVHSTGPPLRSHCSSGCARPAMRSSLFGSLSSRPRHLVVWVCGQWLARHMPVATAPRVTDARDPCCSPHYDIRVCP